MSLLAVVDLNENGALLEDGEPLPASETEDYLREKLRFPSQVTDLFVFAHGWRTSREAALKRAHEMFQLIITRYREGNASYPNLDEFRPAFVTIRWPSESPLLHFGYREMRDRAHALTHKGFAAHILGKLLGYLDTTRRKPDRGPATFQTADGQFLHCIGHSLGGRVLGQAIVRAANPPTPPTLGWGWASEHPFGVDTFLAFQLAAPPPIFSGYFASLLDTAPIHGPIVLTFSGKDKATGVFHRMAEKGVTGVGTQGSGLGQTMTLKHLRQAYTRPDFFPHKIVNVDATWRYDTNSLTGAHSGYAVPESAHLILSLAQLAR